MLLPAETQGAEMRSYDSSLFGREEGGLKAERQRKVVGREVDANGVEVGERPTGCSESLSGVGGQC